MTADDLCFLSATELVRRMKAKELSAREVVAAHIARVEAVNPAVNAIVTFVPEQALAAAAAADNALARGEPAGILHGLPVAHKDLVQTKGIRTTLGSPIFRDWVPDADALIVERLKAAGAITMGKTNTPEFGAGSQTFNPVFGATRNPYDLAKTCGGSSGGAAVALACGMQPIADGSDFGGSLRNPAGYCNVVGFRPSLGRVPRYPLTTAFTEMGVEGPMARTVADVALTLAAMAGPDPRDPRSLETPGEVFLRPLDRDFRGVRVAWSRDLGGLPVDPAVTAVLDAQRATFEALGCEVDDASPDLTGADEAFQVIRAWSMAAQRGPLLAAHRHEMKDTVIWNIEKGLALTGPEVGEAEALRTQVYQRMRQFMERYEFLLCPVSQVPPFDIATEYPMTINGQAMETYIDWMKSCSRVTVTAHPAISVPAGFTAAGLPVGLQIVGRFRDDFCVLQLAHAFEAATGYGRRRPAVAG